MQPWLSVADGCCFQNLTGAHSLQRLPGLNVNWRETVLKRLWEASGLVCTRVRTSCPRVYTVAGWDSPIFAGLFANYEACFVGGRVPENQASTKGLWLP